MPRTAPEWSEAPDGVRTARECFLPRLQQQIRYLQEAGANEPVRLRRPLISGARFHSESTGTFG